MQVKFQQTVVSITPIIKFSRIVIEKSLMWSSNINFDVSEKCRFFLKIFGRKVLNFLKKVFVSYLFVSIKIGHVRICKKPFPQSVF